MSAADRADFQPLDLNLVGVQLAQLAIGVLGVLVITAEYSTGMIRASMSAVPKRLPVLWGKAVVYGVTTLVLMVPAALIAFIIGQAILSGGHLPHLGLGDPGVARAVIGAGLYLTVVGLFGLGIGAIVRNTAGGIAAFAAIMFVLPPLMNVLPSSWNNAASPYLPLAAGQSLMAISGTDHLSPWSGFGLFVGYAAAALVIAAVLLRRRDV
jgi:ABC-type transport system involved in multi-copper enzyme maturation permease subunit